MNEDPSLQLKKDALWDVHVAQRAVACLERRISTCLESAKIACEAWEGNDDGEIFLANDGGLVAGSFKRARTERIQFGSSEDVASLVKELSAARDRLASAQREFDRLR